MKIGILGAGGIAVQMAKTVAGMKDVENYAVAARSFERAQAFAEKYGFSKAYGSYEEMLADPQVDLVYIATPHSHHAEHAKLCLNAGKPVLVEKAFSYNAATTEEVLNLAKEKNLFCGEAMWIRFMPMYRLMAEYIQKGAIGRVNNITCSLGYSLLREERLLRRNRHHRTGHIIPFRLQPSHGSRESSSLRMNPSSSRRCNRTHCKRSSITFSFLPVCEEPPDGTGSHTVSSPHSRL